MFCTLLFANKIDWRHLLTSANTEPATGCKTGPAIGPRPNPALCVSASWLWMWVCVGGCQQGRLSLSRNTGCVREETLNCECLPSVGSSSSQRSALSDCFSESLFADLCYWTRPSLSQQASPIPEGIAPPWTAILQLWEQTLSGCLSVSMFLFLSLSFLCGSNISATSVPIRSWHSTAKHETEAWE